MRLSADHHCPPDIITGLSLGNVFPGPVTDTGLSLCHVFPGPVTDTDLEVTVTGSSGSNKTNNGPLIGQTLCI